MTRFLLAGGVFGAAAASAVATSVAAAPAQALDARYSSSVDGDASYFNVATAAAGGYA
jgi:hypothetical protein